MLALLKLVQSIIRTLHSEGTPTQVALGVALGAALGLTPLVSVHNLVVLTLILMLNVSFGGAMLGWALFVPLGFLLDPAFNRIGRWLLLDTPALQPTWVAWYNSPLTPYTNFNNTIVLGSVVAWLVLFVPIALLARAGVKAYRATLGERVRRSRLYQTVTASKAYNVYTWFKPE